MPTGQRARLECDQILMTKFFHELTRHQASFRDRADDVGSSAGAAIQPFTVDAHAGSNDQFVHRLLNKPFQQNGRAQVIDAGVLSHLVHALANAHQGDKVINSIDARLLDACLQRDISPTSAAAPSTMKAAVSLFFEGKELTGDRGGMMQDWDQDKQLEEAQHITIAVTGTFPVF